MKKVMLYVLILVAVLQPISGQISPGGAMILNIIPGFGVGSFT